MPRTLPWVEDDGGRAAAGYEGRVGDCTCRSIAIATELPYDEVYDRLDGIVHLYRQRARTRASREHLRGASAITGVPRKVYDQLLIKELGWTWTPTMFIGSGTRVHLAQGELPRGRLIVALSQHMTAVLDDVVHDTYDPGRAGTRCVYGFFRDNR